MKLSLFFLIAMLAYVATAVGTPHILEYDECQMFMGHCTKVVAACHYIGIQGRRLAIPVYEGEDTFLPCPRTLVIPFAWSGFRGQKMPDVRF